MQARAGTLRPKDRTRITRDAKDDGVPQRRRRARRVSSGQPEHNKLPVVAAHESLHDSVATTMTVPRHAQLGGHRRHRHLTHLLLGVRQAHHGSWARAIAVRFTSASTWIAPSLSTHIFLAAMALSGGSALVGMWRTCSPHWRLSVRVVRRRGCVRRRCHRGGRRIGRGLRGVRRWCGRGCRRKW